MVSLAQGIALGIDEQTNRPERAKVLLAMVYTFALPGRTNSNTIQIPRAMHWAVETIALSGRLK